MKLQIIEMNDDSLPLINNGSLSIYFIGSGSAFSKKLYQNNIVVTKGNTSVFVDIGTRTPEALAKLGLNTSNIENLIITHSHADHLGGLEEVALMNRYFFNKKPNLFIPRNYAKILWNKSLSGGCKYSEKKSNGQWLRLSDFFKPKYLKSNDNLSNKFDGREFYETNIKDLNIIFFQTKHIPSNATKLEDFQLSYGLIFDKKIVFTSDTMYDPKLISFLEKNFSIDRYFHDCQLFSGGVHASIEELKELPKSIRSKMFLMHYGDNFKAKDNESNLFAGFARQNHIYSFK